MNIAPPCHISSAYGDPMEDEIIQDIAITFAALDHELLGVLKVVLDNAASGGLSLDPDSQATMQQDREMISGLQSQFGDIRAGKHGFCRQYLQEGFMLTIWARAGGALSQMLDVDPEDQSNNRLLESVDNMFRILQRAAEPLSDRIPRAAAQGVLEAEDRAGIRLRMLKLDELFDMYHRKKSTLRTLKAWQV